MALIQAVNSKANVKKKTNQDLPFSPQQPVIASYYAISTTSQSTISNLGFSVDQSNTDNFFLFVDGKLLRLGSSADYTFTNVGSDNTSSSIALNQTLVSGLNIQAFKMGLKKESEFLTDNRFVNAYEYLDKSFQGWVNQSTLMTPTSSAGTPAAGTFYSQINSRASMVDLSQDLKPRMGIERLMTQSLYLLPNESGPNGEQVSGVVNDTFGQLRLVGRWAPTTDVSGSYVTTTGSGDFIEVVFYGTGINLLGLLHVACDLRASVDGGSEGSDITVTGSNILNARNYAQNQVLPVLSGLTLGVHTVKVRLADATSFLIQGVEILNESSSLKINPGIGYIQGKKLTTSAQSVQAFGSSFESGILGSRGGRVLVYQKADGTIAKALQPTNASQANLTSADHSNEEVTGFHHWRKFGAGRADDFSLAFTNSSRAFTLDDGTTTLIGNSVLSSSGNNVKGASSASFVTLTFVGTGLDVVRNDESTSTNTTGPSVIVDGTSVGTLSAVGVNVPTLVKLVSGLPYGTHTVKLTAGSANVYDPGWNRFLVYGPKKPALPAGAIEVGDYNVMATYVANSTAANENIATGVLRKFNTREWFYQNTWSISSIDITNYVSGFETFTSTNGAYVEYTFFGTGFEFRGRANTAWSATNTVSLQSLSTGGSLLTLNSTNFPGLTTSNYGGFTFTYASGNLSLAASNTLGSGFSVSGLTLGLYKVRITTGTANNFSIDAIDIITPIHAPKSNLYADLQNTLPVGSCAISDNRKTTPTKDSVPAIKAWVQAIGITSAPTTTSTSFVPMADMSCEVKTNGGSVDIRYSANVFNSTVGAYVLTQVYVNGVAVGTPRRVGGTTANVVFNVSDFFTIPLAAGTHKIDVYWSVDSGTGSGDGVRRNLAAREA